MIIVMYMGVLIEPISDSLNGGLLCRIYLCYNNHFLVVRISGQLCKLVFSILKFEFGLMLVVISIINMCIVKWLNLCFSLNTKDNNICLC